MLKYLYSRQGGAATGFTAVILSIALVAAAVLTMCAAAFAKEKRTAVIIENGAETAIYTRAETIDDFIAEQRAGMHPFDMITYAGCGENGEFEIAVEREPYVNVADGDSVRTVRALRGETVSALLAREKIDVGEYDHVDPALDSEIADDCDVTVTRAFPVTVAADGSSRTVLAAGITVGELLEREGIALGEDDELNCGIDEKVRKNMTISVSRVEYRKRTKSQFIPYETEYVDSPLLKIGDSETVTEGADGNVTIEITDKYVNGIKLSSEATYTEKTDPVNEVIARGTALNTPYSKREGSFTLEDGIPTEYAYVLDGKVTAYTAREGSGTYSGRPLVIGSVGVDPDVIPFGSEVYIVSKDGSHVYGYAVASDTGDIKGTGIVCDAYMGTTSEHYSDALSWGAQFCYVYVLTVGDNSVSWR